jgi:small acid-soluble spore protein H (minor)
MDVNRAKEIVDSVQIVEVQLEGQSVWIDSVDATTQTATVHTQSGQAEPKTVQVQQLREIHH